MSEQQLEYVARVSVDDHKFTDGGLFDGRRVSRPTWDETWMAVAATMARRSTCLRGQTGAVVVDSMHQLLSIGYNGAPRKMHHCLQIGCEVVDGHCVRALHAEQNAIINAARVGVSLVAETMYSTTRPCYTCAKMVVAAGIQCVVFRDPYLSDGIEGQVQVVKLFDSAGVTMLRMGSVRANEIVVE